MKRRFLPDSLAGRMALILIAGILLLHLVSLSTYDLDRVRVLGDEGLDRISERVASTVRIAERAKPIHRPDIASDLSNPTIILSWTPTPLITDAGHSEASKDITDDLVDWLSLPPERVVVNSKRDGNTFISVQLDDGTWINAKGAPFKWAGGDLTALFVSTSVAAVGILVLSLFLVRWITMPLRKLSEAADRLGVHLDSPALVLEGPVEVSQAAIAFNSMQARIQRFVSDRTQMFAAISHDLKTPITRLKLRAEFIDDDTERTRMLRDLDDMEQMIASLLAFLRDETRAEDARLVDLSTIVRTICDDFTDAGHLIELSASSGPYVLHCRSSAIKRAVSNIVDNAFKYAGSASVRLWQDENFISIEVTDTGPGIPDTDLERVFRPFERLEASRNRETGGTGLGLTIVRTIARSHGGDVMLQNVEPHGLRVTLTFPKPSDTSVT